MNKLNIGIACYPSIGGSGIVATSLGNELARRGHKIHFISYEIPFRLNLKAPNVRFHQVKVSEYQLFRYPDYTLPLAVTMSSVHQKFGLDILHVHYAVPHATAALLSCQILRQCGEGAPKIITTLHGTDITLLARDPSLYSIIKYSIEKSDGVTAVSQNLKYDTLKVLKTKKLIEVIYNFYTPQKPNFKPEQIRKKLRVRPQDFLAVHLSNLRPVKRVPDLLKITAALKKHRPNFKLLILAGGNFAEYQPIVKKLKIQNRVIVKEGVLDIKNYITAAEIGLYASEQESFGLGILETMAYGKPVLATNIGGIPEVVEDKKQGFLFPVGAVGKFAKKIEFLMDHPEQLKSLGQIARLKAKTDFATDKIVTQYENYYQKILKK